jgi:hypothetical protein
MRYLISLLLIGFSLPSLADIEIDKDAGICAGYLATRKSIEGMEVAIRMADNQSRAMQFADNWLTDVERMKNNELYLRGKVYSADSSCRRVGIRPADYKSKR